jgi:sRNA-binding protein
MHSKAAIAHLAAAFPQAFFTDAARRRPLRIGIANDIAPKLDGALRPKDLHRALGHYANSIGYLRSFKVGAARINLAGNEAGIVTAEEADHAHGKLAAVLARRTKQKAAAPEADRKQQTAGVGRGADSHPRESPATRLTNDSAAGRREIATCEQRPEAKASMPARIGFAELRASAAQRKLSGDGLEGTGVS